MLEALAQLETCERLTMEDVSKLGRLANPSPELSNLFEGNSFKGDIMNTQHV
jgi:hypothetical protein